MIDWETYQKTQNSNIPNKDYVLNYILGLNGFKKRGQVNISGAVKNGFKAVARRKHREMRYCIEKSKMYNTIEDSLAAENIKL